MPGLEGSSRSPHLHRSEHLSSQHNSYSLRARQEGSSGPKRGSRVLFPKAEPGPGWGPVLPENPELALLTSSVACLEATGSLGTCLSIRQPMALQLTSLSSASPAYSCWRLIDYDFYVPPVGA